VTARAILAGCDDPTGHALIGDWEALSDLTVAAFPKLADAMAAIEAGSPTVVVTCPSVRPAEAMGLAESLQARDSDIAVVMVTHAVDESLLRAALQAGIRAVLTADDGPEALASAVMMADARVVRRRDAGSAPEAPPAAPEPEGMVITVFSPKGGVGKSVLATNLGAVIAKELGKSTILVDLDLQFGDVAVMLKMPPDRTIFDAAQAFDRLDAEMLEGFLIPHDSGLRALLAPVRPEDAESVTAGRVAQILRTLRQLADVVVVDTPASLSDVVLTALEQSDVILAVATMDVPSVKNTKVALQKLHQLGLDGRGVQLVLNRADSKVWLDPHEIERAMSDKIIARVPSDRLVPRCVNMGVPVVLHSPRSAVARSISALARDLVGS
jgi:pilus assembly protein CpaE